MVNWKRWLWFLTRTHREPLAYGLPCIPPRGRAISPTEVVEERDWFCNPRHVELFRSRGLKVQADPHCPLYSRERRWIWER